MYFPDLNQQRALVVLNKVRHQIDVDVFVDAHLSILQICTVQKAEHRGGQRDHMQVLTSRHPRLISTAHLISWRIHMLREACSLEGDVW